MRSRRIRRRKGARPEHIAAFKELSDFLTAEVAARRANPTDDLITHLAEAEIDGDRLSEREVVLTTATFVMAGVESLSSFMSMFALNLHDYPDARRRLVADPALIAPAIEESLRFNTSAQRFKRTATRDVDVHGETIRAGDKVALAFGSANRDERKFSDPDTFDIDRRPLGHLGFGSGKHFCLGAQMARLVTEIAMRRFLDRVPDYHLTVDRWPGIRRRISAVPWHCRLGAGRNLRSFPRRRESSFNVNFGACAGSPLSRGRAEESSRSAPANLLQPPSNLVSALLVRKLVEHGVDHAGLVPVDEGGGDVDIFRGDDPRRHVAPDAPVRRRRRAAPPAAPPRCA